MENWKKALNNMPLWILNLISVLSGIATIITPIAGFTIYIKSNEINIFIISAILAMFCFIVILFFKMKKYRQLAEQRMRIPSEKFHLLTQLSRDTYFDTLNSYKTQVLTEEVLHSYYVNYIKNVLDSLCDVLQSYTTKKICACVKLCLYNNAEEIIDNNSTLTTFCRSSNSDTNRKDYESQQKDIIVKDNTDFRDIVEKEANKNYFYQPDLTKFSEKMNKINKKYKNTNVNWEKYYKGTIVVPIRIEFKKLYDQQKNDDYHIIGFLCVDSMDNDAFTFAQENYNVDIVKAYANIIYILLSQYNHFRKKITNP